MRGLPLNLSLRGGFTWTPPSDPSYAAALDFDDADYWASGTGYAPLSTFPGYTYTRSGQVGFVNAAGAVEYFAANVPPILADIGYQAYGAATNVLLQSQVFDNASWTKDSTLVTANALAAPDGTTTADKLNHNAGAGVQAATNQSVVKAAAIETWTVSTFAKKGEWNFLHLLVGDGPLSSFVESAFNLNLGTAGAATTGGAAGFSGTSYIKALANGWYRCTLVVTTNAAASINLSHYISDNASRIPSAGGGGTSGIYLWEAEAKQGNYPDGGPIIVTTGATASIGDSVLDVTDALGADADQLFIARAVLAPSSVNNARIAYWGDAAANNRIDIQQTGTGSLINVAVVSGGVAQYTSANVAFTGGTPFTAVVRRLSGNWRLGIVVGGVLTWADAGAAGSLPTIADNKLKIGMYAGNNVQPNDNIIFVGRRLGTFAADADVLGAVYGL